MNSLPAHRTKIIATIGPAFAFPEIIERMIRAGLNGSVVLLVAGPSPRNPGANHRFEFLELAPESGAGAVPPAAPAGAPRCLSRTRPSGAGTRGQRAQDAAPG
jgi:hypothetical protein